MGDVPRCIPLHSLMGRSASFQVLCEHLVYRFHSPSFRCRKHVLNDPGNVIESDLAFQERRHRHFVGGVQGYRLRASGFGSLIGQS